MAVEVVIIMENMNMAKDKRWAFVKMVMKC